MMRAIFNKLYALDPYLHTPLDDALLYFYESCKRDLNLFIHLLDNDGIMPGDDYETFPGVTQTAHEFTDENSMALAGTRNKFAISKNKKHVKAVQDVVIAVDECRARVAAAKERQDAKT